MKRFFFFLLTIRSAVHLCNAMLSLVVHAVHADMKVHVFRIAEKCITRISGMYIFCNYSYHHIVRTNHQRINSFYSLYLLFSWISVDVNVTDQNGLIHFFSLTGFLKN